MPKERTEPFLTFYHMHDGQVASSFSETTDRRPVTIYKTELLPHSDCRIDLSGGWSWPTAWANNLATIALFVCWDGEALPKSTLASTCVSTPRLLLNCFFMCSLLTLGCLKVGCVLMLTHCMEQGNEARACLHGFGMVCSKRQLAN